MGTVEKEPHTGNEASVVSFLSSVKHSPMEVIDNYPELSFVPPTKLFCLCLPLAESSRDRKLVSVDDSTY